MWNKRKLNCPSLNSLIVSCMKQCSKLGEPNGGSGGGSAAAGLVGVGGGGGSEATCCFVGKQDASPLLGPLPIHVRQEILDYLVRERVKVSALFIAQLLADGGLYKLDLWSISDYNNYNGDDVCLLLETLIANNNNLRELSIGGPWIYNSRIVNGPLRRLFNCNLSKLTTLRVQQTSSLAEFLALLEACPNLVQLEIRHPSLSDRDILEMDKCLPTTSVLPIFRSLKELEIPSSVRRVGLIKLIGYFSNLQYLKCARFECVLDAVNNLDAIQNAQMAHLKQLLFNLRGLAITHPLGCDTVSSIVARCPNLEELSLEVQESMRLESISKLTKLRKLKLRNSPNLSTSFISEVLPILNSIGSNLNSLSIEQFDVVDLKALALQCPNLKAFSAQWFTIIGCNQASNEYLTRKERETLLNRFSNLTYLRLRPRAQGSIPPDCIRFLLSRAYQIEDIELYSCHNLSDEDIETLRRQNCLDNLKVFILRHGHSVTKASLNRLTSNSKKLQYLDWGRPTLSKAELVPNEDEDVDQL